MGAVNQFTTVEGKSQAIVEEHAAEKVPVRRKRNPEVFAAEHEGETLVTTTRTQGEDGSPITTTHTRPGTLVMYKPSETQGYVPRVVSASAIRLLLRQGWHEQCPDCGKRHIDKQGRESTDPNLCDAREPVAVRLCPVCRKRVYDNVSAGESVGHDADDPNVIEDKGSELTGAERTKVLLDLHMWHRHPRQAQMRGLAPLPQALREMVEGAKPV